MNKTINYYNENAKIFYDRTINADLSNNYRAFLKHLPKKGHILDAGCGCGLDSKYFLSQGYDVTAFDASLTMADLASQKTGLIVRISTFQDINFYQKFDGVWAHASLLHVPYEETKEVYKKIYNALKPEGVFYATYMYGKEHMQAGERDFYNMDEEKVLPYFGGMFDVVEIWKTADTRQNRVKILDMGWLNFIVKKRAT